MEASSPSPSLSWSREKHERVVLFVRSELFLDCLHFDDEDEDDGVIDFRDESFRKEAIKQIIQFTSFLGYMHLDTPEEWLDKIPYDGLLCYVQNLCNQASGMDRNVDTLDPADIANVSEDNIIDDTIIDGNLGDDSGITITNDDSTYQEDITLVDEADIPILVSEVITDGANIIIHRNDSVADGNDAIVENDPTSMVPDTPITDDFIKELQSWKPTFELGELSTADLNAFDDTEFNAFDGTEFNDTDDTPVIITIIDDTIAAIGDDSATTSMVPGIEIKNSYFDILDPQSIAPTFLIDITSKKPPPEPPPQPEPPPFWFMDCSTLQNTLHYYWIDSTSHIRNGDCVTIDILLSPTIRNDKWGDRMLIQLSHNFGFD